MIILGLCIWLIIPYGLLKINLYFNLPQLHLPILKFIGTILIIFSLLVVIRPVWLFYYYGKGTPIPIYPPKKFVVKDIYKYMRNPMYTAHLLIFLGEFFIFGSLLLLIYFSLAFLLINSYVILIEELTLKKRFGKEYKDYLKKVPRWGIKISN